MSTLLEPFTGEETFAAPPARVFAALINPDTLGQAIPGRVSSERVDDRTLRCTVRPGFSFIRANLRLTVTVVEATPDAAVHLNVISQGIGASMKVDCHVRISPVQGGDASRIVWEARVTELSGLLAAVSPALIRGAADKVIQEGWTALRQQIET